MNIRKRHVLFFLFLFFVILCGEFVLRFVFGFCDAVLYRADDKYEYIVQPSQDRHRLGAHFKCNSYSQRNDEPDTTRVRVLGLGDSVIFGGTWMDQESLASTLFSEETGAQMLNVSSGSWGPDNCAAYIDENGVFGAKAMVLVCSSHDAFDVMTHAPVVGVLPNYPEKQYRLAWLELVDRYVVPRLRMAFLKSKMKLDPDEQVVRDVRFKNTVGQKSPFFNKGFGRLLEIAKDNGMPFVIYLHAETDEIAAGRYNEMGQMIIRWAHEHNVRLVQGLHNGERMDMYHDNIHFNERGQRHLADCLKECLMGIS